MQCRFQLSEKYDAVAWVLQVMKNRCQVRWLKSSICTWPKKNIKFRASNDMHQLLHPVPSGLFILWMWNEDTHTHTIKGDVLLFAELKMFFYNIHSRCVKCAFVTTNISIFLWVCYTFLECLSRKLDINYIQSFEIKMQLRPDKERGESCLVSAAPLWITSRYICNDSPAQGGSNGGPPARTVCSAWCAVEITQGQQSEKHFNPTLLTSI